MVWCRREADSRGASDCLKCRGFAGLSYDAQGGAQEVVVFCEVDPLSSAVTLVPPIAQLVDRDLICVRPDVSVRRAVAILLANQLDSLPIVDETGVPLGLVTARALLLCHESPEREVGLVAPSPPCLITPLSSIADVLAKMRQSEGDHVLVVCRDGRLIGVLGARDLLAWLRPAQ